MAGRILSIILLCTVHHSIQAQNKISADEAVRLSLERHPEAKSAALKTERNHHLEKSSINLPNPEVLMESTTGNYQTLGFLQSFDFPTVYTKQHAIARQQTAMSILSNSMSNAEVEAQTRLAYLDAQYFQQQKALLQDRDSIYKAMSNAASRNFAAGEADAMSVSYAQLQHAEVARQLNQCTADYESSMEILNGLTGISTPFDIEVMKEMRPESGIENDTTAIRNSLFIQYAQEQNRLTEKQLSLERNKALPGFVVGYLNQAESNTPFDMRIRAGITIPLWWWQYSGNIKAAKKQVEIAEQEAALRMQEVTIQVRRLNSDYKKFKSSLNYFEAEGLQQVNALLTNSQRLFEAGSIDYINHLRNMNDAYQQQFILLETLRNLNKTIIQLNYITSK